MYFSTKSATPLQATMLCHSVSFVTVPSFALRASVVANVNCATFG